MKAPNLPLTIFLCLASIGAGPAEARDLTPSCNLRAQQKTPSPDAALVGPEAGVLTAVPLNTVQIIDPGIARRIVVQSVHARRSPTQTIELAARFFNCTDYRQQILVRSQFMDPGQFPSEPPSAWRTVFIDPRSFSVYAEHSSGGAKVRYFLVEVTEAR